MLELLKNSMRSTVDFHGVDTDNFPLKGSHHRWKENKDVVITFSDEGVVLYSIRG